MSAKRIRNRFPKPCRRCKGMIPSGTVVYWRKGYGIYHLACETPQDSAPKTPVDFVYALEWADLKAAWKSFVGGNDNELDRNLSLGERFRSRWQKDSSRAWTGATTDDMRLWLAAGYRVEGLKLNPALVPTRERRKLRFAEEGELQIDLAMSGFDYPFLEWQKRIARPGMTVNVALQFNSHTPVETVAAYAKWVARAIQAIETAGYNIEVNVVTESRKSFERNNGKLKMVTRVKKENEHTDFLAWSALFSPGGFRMLTFFQIMKAGDHFNKTVANDLGIGESNPWKLDYNRETATLNIFHGEGYDPFPGEVWTNQLSEILNPTK